MNLDQAITLLKNAVKESTIEGQMHIDLTLVDALEREHYEKALMITRVAVQQEQITQEDLEKRLGLV